MSDFHHVDEEDYTTGHATRVLAFEVLYNTGEETDDSSAPLTR